LDTSGNISLEQINTTLQFKKRPTYIYDCSFYKRLPISIISDKQCIELTCNITVTDLPTLMACSDLQNLIRSSVETREEYSLSGLSQ